MIELSENKKYSQVVNILIFIFPIVINSLQVAGDLVLFIFAMMGIYVAITQKISPFSIKEIKVFSFLTFGYFIAVCLSVQFSGKVAELAHFIPRDLHFLFAPFIALALFKAKINLKYLLMGSKVALLILGIIVFTGLLLGEERPSGIMNPAVFSNLAVSLFFIVFVFFQSESIKHKMFTFVSLLFGLFSIVLSGTRGAWLSFLLIILVYLYFFYKQKIKLSKKSIIIIFLVITSILTFGSFSQSLKDRSQLAYVEIQNWKSGDTSQTSIGLRLEMYTLAIEKIKDVPFFGHGYRTSNVVIFADAQSKGGHQSYTFNHLHNAYLTNYFNGGIVLLGALLLILFIPLRKLIKANNQDRENPLFIAGILFILGYSTFGLVNILLGDTYMNGFYVFFLAILLLQTNKVLDLKKPEKT